MAEQHFADEDAALDRENKAWSLRTKGMTLEAVAAEMGMSISGVSRMLTRVRERKSRELHESIEGWKAEQTEMLMNIVSEMSAAWEKSKKQGVLRITSKAGKKAAGGQAATPDEVTNKEALLSAGDPQYIDRAIAALAEVRKINGWDAPIKTALTNPEGDKEATFAGMLDSMGPMLREMRKWQPIELTPMPGAPKPGDVAKAVEAAATSGQKGMTLIGPNGHVLLPPPGKMQIDEEAVASNPLDAAADLIAGLPAGDGAALDPPAHFAAEDLPNGLHAGNGNGNGHHEEPPALTE